MDVVFKDNILKRLDNIEALLLNKYKEEQELLVKQEAKFQLKSNEISNIFYSMFLKCDTEEQSLWLKNRIIDILEQAYETEKNFRNMFND